MVVKKKNILQISEKEVKKIMEIPGEVRGVVFQTDAKYILSQKGEKWLSIIEKELEGLGHAVDYRNAKALKWHPLGLRMLSLLAIKEIFNLKDEDVKEMGNIAPKHSFVAKLLMKYFLKPKKSFQQIQKYWDKHYTIGTIKTVILDEKKKYATIILKDINVHPVFCKYLEGYFLRIAQYVIKSKKIEIQEEKCVFNGGTHHQYRISWK